MFESDTEKFIKRLGGDESFQKELERRLSLEDLQEDFDGVVKNVVVPFAQEKGFKVFSKDVQCLLDFNYEEKKMLSMGKLSGVSGGARILVKGITVLMGCLSVSGSLLSMTSNFSTTAYAVKDSDGTKLKSGLITDENGVMYSNDGKTIVKIPANVNEITLSSEVENIVPNLSGKTISFADDFSFDDKGWSFWNKISEAKINYDKVVYLYGGKILAYIPDDQKKVTLSSEVEDIVSDLHGKIVSFADDFSFEEKDEFLWAEISKAEINCNEIVYINGGGILAYIPDSQEEITLSNEVEEIIPDLCGKTVTLGSDFSLEGKSESLLEKIKKADEVKFLGTPMEGLITNYTKNKKFIDLFPTDEERLKPYLNIKIDKHASESDEKHYKNLSENDYLSIHKQVLSILNKRFDTGISEKKINEANNKKDVGKLIQKFDRISRKEKAKAIYDWVTENISYNEAQLSFEEEDCHKKNFAATVFNLRTGMCRGFAELSKIMMRMAGVPCFVCIGEEHAYNFICIEDDDGEGKLVWSPMDSCYGSYKVMNAELNVEAQKAKEQKRKPDFTKYEELYGKVTAKGERDDNYFPMSEMLRKMIVNCTSSHEIKFYTYKNFVTDKEVVKFEIWPSTEKIFISGNKSEELTIPEALQNLDGYELFLPDDTKILNLGNSKFSEIWGLSKVEKVSVSENNPKYKDDNGTIIDRKTGKILFIKKNA